jgi:DNA gyrase subunit B
LVMMQQDIPLITMRESVLRAPGMYIGHQWDTEGLYFLLFEVMRLAIQPESANLSSNLKVIIESETVLSIIDDGRGLPIEPIRIAESVERPKIEHVLSMVVTSHPSRSYFEEFGFLDYPGCVLNAVSEHLQVETNFEGHRYELTCARGEIVIKLRKVADPVIPNKGTRLTVTPDPVVFPAFKFEFETLNTRLHELKHEFPSINMTLEDKRSNQKIDIQNPI